MPPTRIIRSTPPIMKTAAPLTPPPALAHVAVDGDGGAARDELLGELLLRALEQRDDVRGAVVERDLDEVLASS